MASSSAGAAGKDLILAIIMDGMWLFSFCEIKFMDGKTKATY